VRLPSVLVSAVGCDFLTGVIAFGHIDTTRLWFQHEPHPGYTLTYKAIVSRLRAIVNEVVIGRPSGSVLRNTWRSFAKSSTTCDLPAHLPRTGVDG
jgi:hypothetical protein